MGDLSFEYQDAVIAANYTENENEATAIEITYKVPQNTNIEDIEKALKEVGIDGSTLHFDSNELTIIAFSQEEYKEIINKLKNINYEYKEHNLQNSRYLDNESRRNTYRSWLNSEKGKQNRKLYNACSKALAICEATANVEESERLKKDFRKEKENVRVRAFSLFLACFFRCGESECVSLATVRPERFGRNTA